VLWSARKRAAAAGARGSAQARAEAADAARPAGGERGPGPLAAVCGGTPAATRQETPCKPRSERAKGAARWRRGIPARGGQVVEAGLGHLPFTERSVVTPTGNPYVGVDFAKKLCGVSIIRSGESMENALRACCKGIKIGKILVHRCAAGRRGAASRVSQRARAGSRPAGSRNADARLQTARAGVWHRRMRLTDVWRAHTAGSYPLFAPITSDDATDGALGCDCRVQGGRARARRVGDKLVQQELIYEKLPADIAERHVLLLDPILATGNSAARAIQVPPRAGARAVRRVTAGAAHQRPIAHGLIEPLRRRACVGVLRPLSRVPQCAHVVCRVWLARWSSHLYCHTLCHMRPGAGRRAPTDKPDRFWKRRLRLAQVVLEKGVDEGRILFLTLIAAPEGIHRICRSFPRVKVRRGAEVCPRRPAVRQGPCHAPCDQHAQSRAPVHQRGAPPNPAAHRRGARLTGAPLQVITSEIDEGIDEQTYQVVPGARGHASDVSAAASMALLPPSHALACLGCLSCSPTSRALHPVLTAALGGGSAGVGEFGDRYFCD